MGVDVFNFRSLKGGANMNAAHTSENNTNNNSDSVISPTNINCNFIKLKRIDSEEKKINNNLLSVINKRRSKQISLQDDYK